MAKSLRSPRQERLRTLLIEARQTAELTQADVAQRLGKPQSFIAKYEGGERRLDVVEFLDLAKAIGFDAAKMLRRVQRVVSPGVV